MQSLVRLGVDALHSAVEAALAIALLRKCECVYVRP